jgi:hypothetical protein
MFDKCSVHMDTGDIRLGVPLDTKMTIIDNRRFNNTIISRSALSNALAEAANCLMVARCNHSGFAG